MKVLFIGPVPPPVTGQAIACELLLERLLVNHAVQVVDLSKQSFRQGMNSVSRLMEVLRAIWRIWRWHRAADVIYLTISESIAGNLKDVLIYVACLGRLNRMVVHLHGGAGMRRIMERRGGLLRWLNASFLRRMGGVIVLGESLRSIYRELYLGPRLHSIANFSHPSLLIDEAALERKFSDRASLRLLFLSNLLPGKGHVELLESLSHLDERQLQRLRVDFAGGFESAEDEAAFRRKAQDVRGLVVHVHGPVHGSTKLALLHSAHVFCLPTYYPYEGQPISILEAYAAGCAVITTDHSGIRDIFRPGQNGIEVPKMSPVALGAAIGRMLEDVELMRAFARRNRQDAERQYSLEVHLREISRVLEDVARGATDSAASAVG